MNSSKTPKGSVTKPLLKDLVARDKENEAALMKPIIGSTPLPASDLFQDPGAGYNLDYTFPQE